MTGTKSAANHAALQSLAWNAVSCPVAAVTADSGQRVRVGDEDVDADNFFALARESVDRLVGPHLQGPRLVRGHALECACSTQVQSRCSLPRQ
jgi:hypothetical protein